MRKQNLQSEASTFFVELYNIVWFVSIRLKTPSYHWSAVHSENSFLGHSGSSTAWVLHEDQALWWVHIAVDVKEPEPVCCDRKFFVFIPLPGVWNVNAYWHAFILLSDAVKLVCKECSLVSTPVGSSQTEEWSSVLLAGLCLELCGDTCSVWRSKQSLNCSVALNATILICWILEWRLFAKLCLFAFSWSVYFLWGIYNAGFVCSPQSLLSYVKSILVGKRKKLCMLAEK